MGTFASEAFGPGKQKQTLVCWSTNDTIQDGSEFRCFPNSYYTERIRGYCVVMATANVVVL